MVHAGSAGRGAELLRARQGLAHLPLTNDPFEHRSAYRRPTNALPWRSNALDRLNFSKVRDLSGLGRSECHAGDPGSLRDDGKMWKGTFPEDPYSRCRSTGLFAPAALNGLVGHQGERRTRMVAVEAGHSRCNGGE